MRRTFPFLLLSLLVAAPACFGHLVITDPLESFKVQGGVVSPFAVVLGTAPQVSAAVVGNPYSSPGGSNVPETTNYLPVIISPGYDSGAVAAGSGTGNPVTDLSSCLGASTAGSSLDTGTALIMNGGDLVDDGIASGVPQLFTGAYRSILYDSPTGFSPALQFQMNTPEPGSTVTLGLGLALIMAALRKRR
jgi:hypothetical protein